MSDHERDETGQAETLPCPFCGPSKMKIDNWAGWFARCEECGACQMGRSRAAAIANWNSRPIPRLSGAVTVMARALYEASVLAQDRARADRERMNLATPDLKGWWDQNAAMPLSGPGFVAYWTALAETALSCAEQGE